jgi:HEAT repeat protein
VTSLRERFDYGNAEERRLSIVALGEDGAVCDGDAIELLRLGLGDEDWRVRKESAYIAASRLDWGGPLFDLLVVGITQGENVGLRNAAVEALGRIGAPAVAPLLDALPRVPETAKKFVFEALGDLGDLGAVPVLVHAAEHDEPNTAAAALDALSRIGGPDAERALRRRLSHPDPFHRFAALEGLEKLGASVPYDELVPLLGDRLVRRGVIGLLGRSGGAQAIEPLVDALSDRSSVVLGAAIHALLVLSEETDELRERARARLIELDEGARVRLRNVLFEGDLRTRQAAAHLLVLAMDEPALGEIVALAGRGLLAPAALDALMLWGESGIAPLLARMAASEGPTRAAAIELASALAAEALRGKRGSEAAREVIRRAIHDALDDGDPIVRRAALRSLGLWAVPDDASRLVRSVVDGGDELATTSAATLEQLAAEAPEAVRAALRDLALDGPGGHALAGVVALVEGEAAYDRLTLALRSERSEVRRASVNALARIGGRRAADEIKFALSDDNLDVRSTAARALGTLRDEDGEAIGIEALLLSLETDEPSLLASIARALGNTLDTRAIEPLKALVSHQESQVAVAAIEASRRLDCRDFGSLVRAALRHEDEEVVKQALCTIADERGEDALSALELGLEHPTWHVRVLAARLLADRNDEEAFAILMARRRVENDPMVLEVMDRVLGVDGAN